MLLECKKAIYILYFLAVVFNTFLNQNFFLRKEKLFRKIQHKQALQMEKTIHPILLLTILHPLRQSQLAKHI